MDSYAFNIPVVGVPVLLGFIGFATVHALRRRSIGGCLMPGLLLVVLLVLVLLLVIYPPLG